MPLVDICNECDKMTNLLDWRGLCDWCAEKEDEKDEKMSEAKKRKLQKWIDFHAPKKDKGRAKKPSMTNSYGNVLFSYKSRRNK